MRLLWFAKQDMLRYLGTSATDLDTIRAPSLPVYTVFSDAVLEMDGISNGQGNKNNEIVQKCHVFNCY